MYKIKSMRTLYFILIILLVQCCKSDVRDLRQKYSAEVINYFYETAFWWDYYGQKYSPNKWTKDIYIYLRGDFSSNDIACVNNTIAKLDSLQLPVNIQLTSDSLKANMHIYFGNYSYLKTKGVTDSLFTGKIQIYGNNIDSAKIWIANNVELYKTICESDSVQLRQSSILKGITKSLGITGNSWHYPNSLFFEGGIYTSEFSDIDKSVIQLLYEPTILVDFSSTSIRRYLVYSMKKSTGPTPTPMFSRQQFEEAFGDVLYHINAPQKIADHVLANDIPLYHLEYIREKRFRDSILIKWPAEINIRLNGDISHGDSVFCKHIVDFFNSVSDQFKLTLSNDANKYTGIDIYCIQDGSKNKYMTYDGGTLFGNMMFIRQRVGEIRVKYNNNEAESNFQDTKNLVIFSTLYEMLGFNKVNKDIMELDSSGNVSLKPDYKEILALIYEPVFYNGLTIKELEEAIKILKAKRYFSRYSPRQYEKNFGLHYINAPQKIANYVTANDVPLHYLEYIREKCFNNRELVKWQSKIYVRLNGDVSQGDSVFCQSAVSLLNSVSDRFHLTFTNDTLKFPRIDINYIRREVMRYKRAIRPTNVMFPTRKTYEINVKDSIQEKRNGIIFDSLYESLGFNNEDITEGISKFDSSGNISFNPDYKEILALIYEPVFYSGLTVKEFDEAIEILKTKHSN